jgi:hypothetical protein
MSKHTPGPWKWWTTHEGAHRINPHKGGLVIASCDTRNPFSEEQEANARLIAAAPDLLEACKAVKATCPADPDINPEWQAAWDLLLAAIAKAEEPAR